MKKRAAVYSLFATAVTIGSLALGAAPASASIHNTPGYVHIVNSRSGKCIDLSYPDDSHSTDFAQQWRCLNTPFEEWQFVELWDNTAYQIVNHQTGECLAIEEAYTDGAPVLLEPCGLAPDNVPQSQVWGRNPNLNPFVLSARWLTDWCLDLENGDSSDGVPMQVWECNWDTSNQRWRQL